MAFCPEIAYTLNTEAGALSDVEKVNKELRELAETISRIERVQNEPLPILSKIRLNRDEFRHIQRSKIGFEQDDNKLLAFTRYDLFVSADTFSSNLEFFGPPTKTNLYLLRGCVITEIRQEPLPYLFQGTGNAPPIINTVYSIYCPTYQALISLSYLGEKPYYFHWLARRCLV